VHSPTTVVSAADLHVLVSPDQRLLDPDPGLRAVGIHTVRADIRRGDEHVTGDLKASTRSPWPHDVDTAFN